MLTDNGSEFKNKEMQEVCDTLGLKHIFSSGVHTTVKRTPGRLA